MVDLLKTECECGHGILDGPPSLPSLPLSLGLYLYILPLVPTLCCERRDCLLDGPGRLRVEVGQTDAAHHGLHTRTGTPEREKKRKRKEKRDEL